MSVHQLRGLQSKTGLFAPLVPRASIPRVSTRSKSVLTKGMHQRTAALSKSTGAKVLGGVGVAVMGNCFLIGMASCEEGDFQEKLQNIFKGLSGGSGSSKDDNEEDDIFEKLMENYGPLLSQVSFGSCLGFCSGYAVKELSKVVAATIGVLFILTQAGASKGYLDVNWKKVQKDIITAVDPNGDGEITKDDVKIWYKKAMALLKYNLPSSGGFAVGFFFGLTF